MACGCCHRVEERPIIGREYRHFKGEDHIYRVKDIARDANNLSLERVIYENLFELKIGSDIFPIGETWDRSLEEFVGYKNLEGGKTVKRYTLIT
jgi:hypothetical protein